MIDNLLIAVYATSKGIYIYIYIYIYIETHLKANSKDALTW